MNIFQQLFMYQSEGISKILTTPGEKGEFFVKFKVTDTRDMKGVPKTDRWTKAAVEATFLLLQKDPRYIQIRKVVLSSAKYLSRANDVKKDNFQNLISSGYD